MNPKLPAVTPELILFLDTTFPDRCPDPEQTDREVWMAVGSVRVVKKLKQLLKNQIDKGGM